MSFLLSPARRMASGVPAISSRAFSTTRPAHLARMTLVGRLAADPELADSGKFVKYAVGTSYGPKDNRQTSWFRITSFAPEGTSRDYVMGLTRGTLVYLEGDAQMRTYDDADGKKQTALNLIQTKVEVLKRPQPKEDEMAQGMGA